MACLVSLTNLGMPPSVAQRDLADTETERTGEPDPLTSLPFPLMANGEMRALVRQVRRALRLAGGVCPGSWALLATRARQFGALQ
jgi:hypothetical protein